MSLPNKLYINKFMIRPGMLYPAEFPPDNPEEEYIRKDALLEWAKEIAENASWVSIDAVVNKIESL